MGRRPLNRPNMAVYKMLAYQDLARPGGLTRERKLPPILSVVFCNEDREWTASTSLIELVKPFRTHRRDWICGASW